MAKTSEIIAGLAVGAFVGLAAGLALTPGPADAGYGVTSAPAPVSNQAKKADMLVTGKPVSVNRKALPMAVEVSEVQKIGDDFVLLDSKGKIVYRSQRDARTTTIAKNTDMPLITGYGVATNRVEAAFNETSH